MIYAPPTAIEVPAPAASHPVRMIGIHATGPQAELDRLETVTKAAGLPCQQMDGPDGHELVIVLPPNGDTRVAEEAIARTKDGSFKALRFQYAFLRRDR